MFLHVTDHTMRMSLTLSYDEFAEAQIAHGSAAAAAYKKMRVLSNVWGLVSWLGYCALACFYSPWGGDRAHINPFMRDIGLPMLPWVSLLGLLWVMEARKSIGGLGQPWTTQLATPLPHARGLRSWYAIIGWALGVLIGGASTLQS